jgi:DNA-binding XRE family transcriptional regulator
MTQEQLAKRLRISRTPIVEWEANKRLVPRHIELALAEIRRLESTTA